jgi:hypothetical protein
MDVNQRRELDYQLDAYVWRTFDAPAAPALDPSLGPPPSWWRGEDQASADALALLHRGLQV